MGKQQGKKKKDEVQLSWLEEEEEEEKESGVEGQWNSDGGNADRFFWPEIIPVINELKSEAEAEAEDEDEDEGSLVVEVISDGIDLTYHVSPPNRSSSFPPEFVCLKTVKMGISGLDSV